MLRVADGITEVRRSVRIDGGTRLFLNEAGGQIEAAEVQTASLRAVSRVAMPPVPSAEQG